MSKKYDSYIFIINHRVHTDSRETVHLGDKWCYHIMTKRHNLPFELPGREFLCDRTIKKLIERGSNYKLIEFNLTELNQSLKVLNRQFEMCPTCMKRLKDALVEHIMKMGQRRKSDYRKYVRDSLKRTKKQGSN